MAYAQSRSTGSSGQALATSHGTGDLGRTLATTASASAGADNTVVGTTYATFGGSVPGLNSLGATTGAYSHATGAPTVSEVNSALAAHADVAAALEPNSLQAIGIGAMGTGFNGSALGQQTFYASARYTFTLGGSSDVVLGLLDFQGQDSATAIDLSFTVMNFGSTLISQSFTSLADADAYFSDHALLLGSFSGNVDLTISLTLTAAQAQGADFSYLLASGDLTNTVPVPEPSQWALLLMGLGVMGALARRRQGVGR